MNLPYALCVGLLAAIAVHQVLGRDLFRMAFGFYLLFLAMNLLVLAVATRPDRHAPFLHLPEPHTDPLVQAMVLTAIVIGFGLSTFLLLLAARLARTRSTLDADTVTEWRG